MEDAMDSYGMPFRQSYMSCDSICFIYVIESNEIMPCHQQFKSQIFLMTNVKNKINPEIEILEGSKEKDTLKKYRIQ
jgi:hypothetical protein